jgi:hypothetical protein
MKGASTAYTPSACGVGAFLFFFMLHQHWLGVASEWRDELPPYREQWERATFRNTPAAQLMVHNKQQKQHGDKLVKLNEILNEVAPPMRNIQQQFGEGAGHFNL